VIGIFDVLVAAVTAGMLGDELLAPVKGEGPGFDAQFQQGPGMVERHGVAVGFKGDAAAVGGPYPAAATHVVAGQGQGLKARLFLLEGIAGPPARFPMQPHVGHLFHPAAGLGIKGFQGADF
jgi:uncharacterized Zn-binding protein involved in type VI secretion